MTTHAKASLHRQAESTAPHQPNRAQTPANLSAWPGNQSRLRSLAPHTLQPRFSIGPASGPLETQADQTASRILHGDSPSASPQQLSRSAASQEQAPAIVHTELRSPGQPLDPTTRAFMEPRFGYNLASVRIHQGNRAAASAESIAARAYTAGNQIVFAAGEYQPSTPAGTGLLAHELAHVIQQNGSAIPHIQRQPTGRPKTPPPRKDYVFLMGADVKGTGNPFFTYAKIYFKAHFPQAIFVEDKRTLTDLLDWISLNVTDPIGNLYIVSHGNEDGTLFFGLDSSKKNTNVVDLREALHPAGGGSSSLPSVSSVIDAQTKIHIKGCDIGRTKQMVELIDEAFGGKGTVNAPTHEQGYFTDPFLGAQERKKEHDKLIGDFTSALPALPAAPPPVDRKLKGDALKQAKKDHDDAVAALKKAQADRAKALAAEEKRIKPELDLAQARAGIVDTLSGPMFQRPGTKLFTAAELQPEIDRLYPHLSDDQRKNLATRLVKRDPGNPTDQQGQKVDRHADFYSETFDDPASLKEAVALFRSSFDPADNFDQPDNFTKTVSGSGADKTAVFTITGTAHRRRSGPGESYTWSSNPRPVPDETAFLSRAKAKINNPDRFQFTVKTKHTKSGVTTLSATAERVMAYLHHGKLDRSPHEHFTEPESNPDFYTTFAPPPPPKSKSKPKSQTKSQTKTNP